MTYPGNPSVAPDVQRRIVDTFRHTLGVAASGELEEARLGCDFVLRLDPLFSPAQALSDRLVDAAGPVAVDDLHRRVFGDEPMAIEGEAEEPPAPAGGGAPTPQPATGGAAELRALLATLLAERRFAEAMARAQDNVQLVVADPELRRLATEAQERLEAEHYVAGFVMKAREALSLGRAADVPGLLEKVRALDPGHPELAEIAELAAAAAAEAEPESLDLESEPLAYEQRAPPMSFDSEEELGVPDFDFGSLPELPEGLEGALDVEGELPEATGGASSTGLGDTSESPGDPWAPPGEVPPPPPPSGGGTTGASDPDPRIAELLDEGQGAFERGEYQPAVDAWSRIFLIDIDHQEAARRIDVARERRAEQERQLEESYHEALALAVAGDLEGARAGLARVLELHPGHLAAREALARLEKGDVESFAASTGSPERDLEALGDDDAAELQEEIMMPPAPAAGAASRRQVPVVPRPAAHARQTFWRVAAGVLLLALVAGGFLWSRWETLFPNAAPPPATIAGEPEQTPVSRARQQYAEGKRAIAIAQLRRVPPSSPHYQEAQTLIGEWGGREDAYDTPAVVSSEQQARRDELLAQARLAAAERRYLGVRPLLDQAGEIAPLSAEEEQLLSEAQAQLQGLEGLLILLRDGEHERVLRDLWLLREKDPTNPDVRSLLVASYYNMAVLRLQQGRVSQAREVLEEAVGLAPEDPEVVRLAALARSYSDGNQDMLYRILVKYLAPRAP